jgi:hypothetical protein
MIFYTCDLKDKITTLLIYFHPKNSTLYVWSCLFIKETIVFYVIIIFTLHWNGVERGAKLKWNIIHIKWMVEF